MKENKIVFKTTNGADEDFIKLCQQLDDYLHQSTKNEDTQATYDSYNKRDSIKDVMIAYINGEAVACGAMKPYDKTHMELKRIFTTKEARNMGIAGDIVGQLEEIARKKGYLYCILETGIQLKAAHHTYEKAGYIKIPNFGVYKDMKESVCMEHKL